MLRDSGLFRRVGGPVLPQLGVLEFGVDTAGFGELIFENDDAARRLQRGAAGDEFVGAGGDTELVAGVAAVPAVGALRGEEFRGVETTQECLSDAEDVGGRAQLGSLITPLGSSSIRRRPGVLGGRSLLRIGFGDCWWSLYAGLLITSSR
ncbi:hypothetical protein [Rhodococcus globerulus]